MVVFLLLLLLSLSLSLSLSLFLSVSLVRASYRFANNFSRAILHISLFRAILYNIAGQEDDFHAPDR